MKLGRHCALLLLWLGAEARAVREIARMDQPVLPPAPPPVCTITATPPNLEMSGSSLVVGNPSTTLTVTIPMASGPIISAVLYRRNLQIPTTLGGMRCGGGNPPTVIYANDPALVPIAHLAPRPGTSLTIGQTIFSRTAQFSLVLTGPGGNATCNRNVTTSCAAFMYTAVSWTNSSGRYASFNFDDGYFMVNNDPPRCTWSLCQQDGYGNPWPGCCGNRGDDPGCFAPETKIKLADGRALRADEISVGDELWNPVRKQGIEVKRVVRGPEKLPLVEIALGKRILRVSSKHPMKTEKGIKAAEEVLSSDRLLGDAGTYHRITRIQRLPVKNLQFVYNFELATDSPLPDDHMIVAEGIVTGDWYLQESKEKPKVP